LSLEEQDDDFQNYDEAHLAGMRVYPRTILGMKPRLNI
jgi:hypothetical protein